MSDTFIDLRALAQTIDSLIAVYDAVSGDPDLEDGGDDEPTGDEADTSYPEWHTRGSHKLAGGDAEMRGSMVHEDAEDCDPAEQDDDSGQFDEDGVNTCTPREAMGYALGDGAGCPIADPGGCQHDGREHDQDGL